MNLVAGQNASWVLIDRWLIPLSFGRRDRRSCAADVQGCNPAPSLSRSKRYGNNVSVKVLRQALGDDTLFRVLEVPVEAEAAAKGSKCASSAERAVTNNKA